MAVLEALIAREITGVGASVKTSLFAGMADWMNVPLLTYDYSGKVPERVGLNHPSIAPYGAYSTSDGGEVLISIQNEREWGRLCSEVLDRPEMSTDPQFADNQARCKNRVRLDHILHEVFTALPRKELLEKLREAAIAYGEVNGVEGLSNHPALKRVKVDSPTGPLEMVAPPASIDGQQRELGPVPDTGQHSEKIWKEFSE